MASPSPTFDRGLAEEIAQRCCARRARQLARDLTSTYNEALRDSGLRITQLSMLVAIGLSGSLRAGALAERLGLDQSTASRNIARMKEAGWVSADVDPDDARATVLTLTPAGAEAIDAAGDGWREAQRKAGETLGPALSDLAAGAGD